MVSPIHKEGLRHSNGFDKPCIAYGLGWYSWLEDSNHPELDNHQVDKPDFYRMRSVNENQGFSVTPQEVIRDQQAHLST